MLSKSKKNSVSYEFFWRIENFKDWHQNEAKKSLISPLMFSPTEKSSTKFQMKLNSHGLDKESGRVNLSLYFKCFTKTLKLVPIEVKISVVDEKNIKRHTQVFSMAANRLSRKTKVGRYFYRTEDEMKKIDKHCPFFLIIDNVATFHLEMRFLSMDEFNKIVKISEANAKEKEKENVASKEKNHSLLPKIWSALCSLAKI